MNAAKRRGIFERLRIDSELVLSETNQIPAAFEQIETIFQLANRVFANRLQPALQVLGTHGVVKLFELNDDIADFVDH